MIEILEAIAVSHEQRSNANLSHRLAVSASATSVVAPALAFAASLASVSDFPPGTGELLAILIFAVVWVVSAPLGVALGVRGRRSGNGTGPLIAASISTALLMILVVAVLVEWARP